MKHQPPSYTNGLLVLGIGLAVTIGTYLTAAPGAHFYVLWGAVLWGSLMLFRTWRARRAWFELERLGFTRREIQGVVDTVNDANKIHDQPGDDYDSWKAHRTAEDQKR
jgi:hypothetical protein